MNRLFLYQSTIEFLNFRAEKISAYNGHRRKAKAN